MAKLTDTEIKAAFDGHLEPGEALRQWAYGVRQPGLHIIVPLIALAILPGVIAIQMLTRNYLVGLTDRRLIVLQVRGMNNAEVKQMIAYDLPRFATEPARTKTGGLFTHIRIDWPDQPFRAKFHRAFRKGHRAQAMEIAAAVGGAM